MRHVRCTRQGTTRFLECACASSLQHTAWSPCSKGTTGKQQSVRTNGISPSTAPLILASGDSVATKVQVSSTVRQAASFQSHQGHSLASPTSSGSAELSLHGPCSLLESLRSSRHPMVSDFRPLLVSWEDHLFVNSSCAQAVALTECWSSVDSRHGSCSSRAEMPSSRNRLGGSSGRTRVRHLCLPETLRFRR